MIFSWYINKKMKHFSQLLYVIDFMFVFNLFNAEKLHLETSLIIQGKFIFNTYRIYSNKHRV